jgi:glycosyltransferase involved in cell wall biosynthesis
VEKYSLEDCFAPMSFKKRWPRFYANLSTFAPSAARFIRQHASRFDVIDALHGTLPYTKADLGFAGLLVCRSVGFQGLYDQQLAPLQQGPRKQRGRRLGRLINRYIERRDRPLYGRSLAAADLVNVCNADEERHVRPMLRPEQGLVHLPFGLTPDRLASFAAVAADARQRLGKQTVAFIGLWIERKGSHELGDIIRRLVAIRPRTRFKLLGVGGFRRETIWADLGDVPREQIEIVPGYDSAHLPGLLRDATVGVFPSRAEGFCFAVLEKLACGLPTVTYDVPGTRDILRTFRPDWLVRAGDTGGLSARLSDLLGVSPAVYEQLADQCHRAAAVFKWPPIAASTAACYEKHLANLRQSAS